MGSYHLRQGVGRPAALPRSSGWLDHAAELRAYAQPSEQFTRDEGKPASLQQCMPVMRLREDTLPRVVAKPIVDLDNNDQPPLACFQAQRWKIVPLQACWGWPGATCSLSRGSSPEFLHMTPRSRTKRLRDELACPRNAAASGTGPP